MCIWLAGLTLTSLRLSAQYGYLVLERETISLNLSWTPVCIMFKDGIRPGYVVNFMGMIIILFDSVYFRPLREWDTQLQSYRDREKDQGSESSTARLSSLHHLTSVAITTIDTSNMRDAYVKKGIDLTPYTYHRRLSVEVVFVPRHGRDLCLIWCRFNGVSISSKVVS